MNYFDVTLRPTLANYQIGPNVGKCAMHICRHALAD